MIKTGLFGGSFNPIHNGHISLAKQLRQVAQLDEVWLMVSPQNPLKQAGDLLADDLRLMLVRRALEGVEGIVASDYEMHLPKPSYTWNTLQALSRDYPDREFVLMMGGDNWALFDRWYRHEDILNGYRIVVYPREQSTAKPSFPHQNPSIFHLKLIDISSTEIRRRVRAGESIDGMVPETIVNDVMKLYK